MKSRTISKYAIISLLIVTIPSSTYSYGCPAECTCTPEAPQQQQHDSDEDSSASASSSLLRITCEWPHIPGDNIFSTFPHRSVQKLTIQCKNSFPRSRYIGSMFSSFVALRHLTIRNCHSEDSSLPAGLLQGLTRLRTLHLESVSVPGLKLHLNPGSLVGAPNLERFELTYSNLAELPDKSVCHHFKELKLLNLSHNEIHDASSIGYDDEGKGDCTDNHLVMLDLSGNHLDQLNQRSFRGMKNLHILRLTENELASIETGSFDECPRLQELYLGRNNLTNLMELPKSIQILDLSDNRFRSFPPAISNHPNLVQLNMSGNHLQSERTLLSSGDQLTILDLSRNRFVRIGAEFFENSTSTSTPSTTNNLQHLYLNENQLEELAANTFKNAPRLRYLDLSQNRLQRLQKEHLNGLQNLSELVLDQNRISTIADDAFAASPQLRRLSMANNELAHAPTALTLLYYLQRLDLASNRITTIPKFLFDKLPNLRELRLASNQIRLVERYVFEKLPSLAVLDLSSNLIERLATNCFEGTAAVKQLRLDGNVINDIQGNFVGLPQLQSLNLSSNRIAYIDFAMLPVGLRSLYASNNSITHVSNVLLQHNQRRRQPQLIVLDLSANRIKQLTGDMLPNSIETADFSRNAIAKIDDGTTAEKTNLTFLDLSQNLLEEVRLQAVKGKVASIRTPRISLKGNALKCTCNNEWIRTNPYESESKFKNRFQDQSSTIPQIVDYQDLTCTLAWASDDDPTPPSPVPLRDVATDQFLCQYDVLCTNECMCCDFDSCDCKSVCPDGCQCYHDAKYQSNAVRCEKEFQATPLNVKRKIPMHATRIDLSRTEIVELPSNAFFARFKLQQLYLNRTNLATIADNAFNGLTSLEVLDLSSNRLEAIRGTEFQNLPRMHRLFLNDNRLRTIPESLFERLNALRELSLHNNRFMSLPTAIVNYSPTLSTITLGGNPWKCDCDPSKYVFQKWLPENTVLVRDYGTIYCADNVMAEGRSNSALNTSSNSSATALSILPVLAVGQTVIKVNFWTFVSGINITFCRPPSTAIDSNALATGGPASRSAPPTTDDDDERDNSTVKSLVENGQDSLRIMFICIAIAAIVVAIVLVFVIWRFQRYLRCKYSKYSTAGATSSVNSSRTTATTPIPLLQFDAFVSYSAEEQPFVMEHIANRLEQEYPFYNLCLLYRDLPTGPCAADLHRIDDVLITSMERSQRVITIVTRNFLEKEWKSIQLRTAYQYLTKENKRKPIIVIVIDELPEDVDSTLGHYLRINRCLYWNDPLFWQKFMEAMPDRSVQQESATLSQSSHYSDVYGTIVPSRFV